MEGYFANCFKKMFDFVCEICTDDAKCKILINKCNIKGTTLGKVDYINMLENVHVDDIDRIKSFCELDNLKEFAKKKDGEASQVIRMYNENNELDVYQFNVFPGQTDNTVMFAAKRIDATNIMSEKYQKSILELYTRTSNVSRSKDIFYGKVIKELSVPLSTLVGMSAIAMNTADQEKIRECLSRMSVSLKHIKHMANDLSDINNVDLENDVINYNVFDVEELHSNISNIIRHKFTNDNKNIKFESKIHPNMNKLFIADEDKLDRVIMSIISRCAKKTRNNGLITLDIDEEVLDERRSRLIINISDNALDVDLDKFVRVYEELGSDYNVNLSADYESWLSIILVKKIVEFMEGSITIYREGNIAKARIVLELDRVTDSYISHEIENSFRNTSVLIVDDDIATYEYIAYVLDQLGINLNVAASGNDALDEVVSNKYRGRRYNFAIVSMDLEDESGIEIAKSIRNVAGSNMVIALMGMEDEDEIRKKAADTDVEYYICKKNLNDDTFVGILNEIEDRRKKIKVMRYDNYRFNGEKILLIEDNELNREIAKVFLDNANLKVDMAVNGMEALIKVMNSKPGEYKALIMDVSMPVMGGIEATRRIRRLKRADAKAIPIIAMTSYSDDSSMGETINVGMNDYITKPVDEEKLCGVLSKYL